LRATVLEYMLVLLI